LIYKYGKEEKSKICLRHPQPQAIESKQEFESNTTSRRTFMKRILVTLLLAAGMGLVPAAKAQESLDHVHIGVFADYLRLSPTDNNMAGVGARLGFSANRYLRFEAETSYDFSSGFNENFTRSGQVFTNRSNLRIIHGMFGPTLSSGHGPLRLFVTAKGGAINFRIDPRPATFGNFFSSVDDLRSKDVSGVFYPGGGAEGHIGPVGVRFDIGDLMYFNNGAHHNLRMSFGPFLRF
jgi:hypothetical protein